MRRYLSEKIVIVGNGIAAITAIKSIRQFDEESEIYLFGEEKFYPYNRIRLSKGLLTSLDEDKILLQKKEWYKNNHVNIHVHTKVVSIDTNNKKVKLDNDKEIEYTKLLLANGAKNRIPPITGIDKKGVFSLRTLQDARNILETIDDESKILNIGGGIQGLETAWILSQDGKKVIIAELLSRLMPKQLDEKASDILEKAIKQQDIDILLSIQLEEIIGRNNIEGFRTKEQEKIDCDGVLYSIGIMPNIDILKNSGITTNKGIIVDEKMATNIPDVFAAGDIVELDGKVFGLWNMAIEQGKVAGYNIVGKDVTYNHIVPVTTLNAFNLSLFSMGTVDDGEATDILVEEKSEENSYKKILINDQKIIGAIIIGNVRSSPVLKAAIEKEKDLSQIDYKNVSIDEFIEIIKKSK